MAIPKTKSLQKRLEILKGGRQFSIRLKNSTNWDAAQRKRIAVVIRGMREVRGWTISELASKADLSHNTIRFIENMEADNDKPRTKNSPFLSTFVKICAAFNARVIAE
jgi:DNA-binding XRE family transcriptional regulator